MTVTLDKFGRILIPKKVRMKLGLKPGSSIKLDIDRSDTSICLTPIPTSRPKLIVDEYGIPTFHFDTDEVMTYDFVAAIRRDREERGLLKADNALVE